MLNGIILVAITVISVVGFSTPPSTVIPAGDMLPLEIVCGIGTTFWWSCAAASFYRYKKFGEISRTLTADAGGLTLVWAGIFCPRSKHWPIGSLASVDVRRLAGIDLSRSSFNADIVIDSLSGNSKHIRLTSRDPAFLSQVATAFAQTLHLPVNIDPRLQLPASERPRPPQP